MDLTDADLDWMEERGTDLVMAAVATDKEAAKAILRDIARRCGGEGLYLAASGIAGVIGDFSGWEPGSADTFTLVITDDGRPISADEAALRLPRETKASAFVAARLAGNDGEAMRVFLADPANTMSGLLMLVSVLGRKKAAAVAGGLN